MTLGTSLLHGARSLVDRVLAWPDPVMDRLIGAVLFLPSATVLGIALALNPDPAGFGTHRQLGLGGCALLTLTGVPCPMCGMTTTFSHLAHGHLVAGFLNQPFGLVLFTGTVAAALIGASDLFAARGAWRVALRWLERREAWVAGTLLIGLASGWLYKVALMRGILPWSP